MSGTTTRLPNTLPFNTGDLVVSLSGDGDGSGTYTDNQGSPLVLEELTATGQVVGTETLPQTTTVVNGVTNSAVSAEYGSSSEGLLALSADGHSLVIAGYGINAATFNAGESNGQNVYGNAALAQSTSLSSAANAIPRVIADISAAGIDTSTALYNVDNTNNPRSVATVDGTSFYLSGQGVKGDTTQGVDYAADGASRATIINDAIDTRAAAIYNGQLYVSADSKQGSGGTDNISAVGTGLPTSAAPTTILAGISKSIKLTAAQENSVNSGSVGQNVDLSPEQFFFANRTTLYVADGGNPKQGTAGDGGLQKWSYNGTTWTLLYTLSAGLNQVANTAASGTTGLIGLTGAVVGGAVQLYATNSALGDLDPTFVYAITDTLAATAPAPGEAFTQVFAAPADSNVRGVAFAPTSVACYCRGTLIRTVTGEVAVESLAIGDRVVTVSGAAAPIRWIGHRAYAGRFLAGRSGLLPVRIRAGALGQGVPRRDLRISPNHAMFLDGMLVPAAMLVNGTSIVQEQDCPSVEYFHVELAGHDVIWAEGAASETFIDDDSRWLFHNAAAFEAMYPDELAQEARFCAPRVEDGYELESIRQRLAA